MQDMSDFDAVILVMDGNYFPSGSCPALPPWLSSIPLKQAARAIVVVDNFDARTVCERSSAELELERFICARLQALAGFRHVDAKQVTFFRLYESESKCRSSLRILVEAC